MATKSGSKKHARKRRRPKEQDSGGESLGLFPAMKRSKTSSLKEKLSKRMTSKLDGARFRWINEQLYTTESGQAKEMFDSDPSLFEAYHTGFTTQVTKWPVNPLDRVISYIKALPESYVIADFGCGEARLAQSVPNTVHSFDLVAVNSHVTACDMANVPLPDTSVDVCVFCLSLMGTNVSDFIREARRVLKRNGLLKVCEIASRFTSEEEFVHRVERFGFKLTGKKLFSKLFVDMEFKAVSGKKGGSTLLSITLKPCLYKRR